MAAAAHANRAFARLARLVGVDPVLARTELLELMKIGLPISCMYILWMLLAVTTQIVVGHEGAASLASAALGSMYANAFGNSVCLGCASAMDTLLSQSIGAGNYTRVGHIMQRGALILLSLAVPVAFVWWNAAFVLRLLGQSDEVVVLTTQYIRLLIIGLPGSMLYECCRKVLQNLGIMAPLLAINLVALVVNAALCAFLVYGTSLGFLGAPIALSITHWGNVLLGVIYLRWHRPIHAYTLRILRRIPGSSRLTMRLEKALAGAPAGHDGKSASVDHVDLQQPTDACKPTECASVGQPSSAECAEGSDDGERLILADSLALGMQWQVNAIDMNVVSAVNAHPPHALPHHDGAEVSVVAEGAGTAFTRPAAHTETSAITATAEANASSSPPAEVISDADPAHVVELSDAVGDNSDGGKATCPSRIDTVGWIIPIKSEAIGPSGHGTEQQGNATVGSGSSGAEHAGEGKGTGPASMGIDDLIDVSLSDGFSVKAAFTGWGEFLRLGSASACMLVVEWGSYEASSIIAGLCSTVILAAHTVVATTASLSFMPVLGVGIAAGMRVGRAMGRGPEGVAAAKLTRRVLIIAAILYATLNACFILAVRAFWAHLFTDDTAVVSLVSSWLWILAIYTMADSLQCVFSGVLRGVGRPSIAATANVGAYIVVALPVGYVLAIKAGLGLPGIWMAFVMGVTLASIFLSAALGKLDWKKESIKAHTRATAGN